MQITKEQTQNYLNSFNGEFREIFFEKSKTFKFTCVNGIFKTPVFSSLEGFSILSRSGKNEYFKVFSDLENIDEKIERFKEEFFNKDDLQIISPKIILNGKEKLELKNIENINFEIDEIISSTLDLFQEYISKDKKSFVSSSEISVILSHKSFIVGNSEGNFSNDTNFYNTYFIKLIGEKAENREEIYEKITGTDIIHKFNKENFKKAILKSINVLEKQLDGKTSPSGKIDVIIGNEAGGTIIHEAVGHGLEADLQNSSVYKNKIGQKVASENVTVVDNPTNIGERGFYNFDHEGHFAKNTVLIENGILKSYLHNTKTAKKFGVSSTGHGRKETYQHKSLVRMGNTYLLPGTDKKEDLIAKVSHGIYVSRMGGGQVNITNGNFVFKVQNGYLIENGKLTHNVKGATISGNGPEMLNEIYGICDDLNFFDGGTCGKGQSMPVSDACPTILTKLKVSGV
ncbi:MAG: TldD/PmbA family protein [Candidatus Gracilibacteria bacterium]|nr:TldD/PmbA family protein [Candidatus Gracilibacteria bacterium]